MRKTKVFYGYWILAASFVIVFIWSGCGLYAFSLFIKPLQADLGWSRAGVMAAFSIWFLVSGVASPFVGRIVDRRGAREVLCAGAIIIAIGFACLSLMSDLWHYYLGYTFIGIGTAAIGYVPASTVVSNWFKKRRGLAIGIMSTGIGISGIVLSPLIGGYLIPSFGWRVSYLALGILAVVFIIPLALFVIKTRPAEMGLYPDGIQSPETNTEVETSLYKATEGLTLEMALAVPVFWLIAVSYLSSQVSQAAIFSSQVPYLQDAGFTAVIAATAHGIVGLSSAVGKFSFGWLCDHIQAKYAWLIGLVFQVVGAVILMSIGSSSPLATVWIYAIILGVGFGTWLPTMSMLVSSNFGLASFGAIFGAVSLAFNIGSAIGPLAAGLLYDTMNNYQGVFIVSLASYVIAVVAILLVRRTRNLS